MWVFTNNAFVSIVQHRERPNVLLVRGRAPGDVARFLSVPTCFEEETPSADYRYRILASREEVGQALARSLAKVTYPNFKDSIVAKWRKEAAMKIWSIMWNVQRERAGK